MTSPKVVCPYRRRSAPLAVAGVGYSLPPTAGDYKWAETDATAGRPRCHGLITAQVWLDLDPQAVTRVTAVRQAGEG